MLCVLLRLLWLMLWLPVALQQAMDWQRQQQQYDHPSEQGDLVGERR